QLVVDLPSQIAQLLVVELDDVEVVEDNDGLWQVGSHGVDVGQRHVDGHGPNLGMRGTQSPPKREQSVGAFAISHEQDRPGLEVQNHGQIAVPLADRDFVNGDLPHSFQLGPIVVSQQAFPLNVLHQVPTDLQVFGHVLDRHATQQLQNITGKRSGVGDARVGE